MVLKLATEHPHHILPQLFALAHEREFSYDGAAHVKQNLSASRLDTANMLVAQLKTNAAIQPMLTAMQTTLLAYIDLANASTLALQKVGRTKGIKFKEVQARGKRFNETMATLPLAPAVITLSVPLSPRNDYSNVVTIQDFQQTFSITDNGISRPKIVICNGSDGQRYVQLVKGGDDMRQDAVMQQVFAIVNFTLAQDEETQKRNLAIRTYKIIPTTPQTGILEWVQNTAAFGSLLCDRESGVHGRYYPQDWTHGQCREHLKDAADNADKLRRYQDICESFHPAFRFFFLEKFADPVAWVASRLAYSRSVATNSIIGYILGIGDRHAHNILIDTVTAEVVHIDFGIVFEQGKGLGTPETVPFRLTRDVVDGMGVTACEGTFRRSCEEVLRVLRDNASQVMTILEVVIHDPLYKWSLSPLQARMKQNTVPDFNSDLAAAKAGKQGVHHNGHNGNAPHTMAATTMGTKGGNFGKDAAERTLLRVLNKLQGQEDPSSGEALSVEGQVDLLINEARSPHNLSKLFPGWAPWL
jgi:ataxia telangiectasia mutated family protein